MPSKPDFIESDPIAPVRWDTLAARIANAGVLTEAHGEMLALLCSAWADLERARQQFASMGYQQLVVDETTDFLDPTCGSGSSLRAAESLGARTVLGLEINPDYANAAEAETQRFRLKRRAAL